MGRFILYPTSTLRANSEISFNVRRLKRAVSDFAGADNVEETITRLHSNGTLTLIGNKGFRISDYMMQRQQTFDVATMISTRSTNTEIVSGANIYAHCVAKGSMPTYMTGDEYTNITVAWNWNLISSTSMAHREFDAYKSQGVKNFGGSDFVAVVSDGSSGIAFEQYVELVTDRLRYTMTRIYLNVAVVVVISDTEKIARRRPSLF